jgi:hypothetical protein
MSYGTYQIFREFGFIQKEDATEEAHSRTRRPSVVSEKKATHEEPPFIKWGRSGQKMNLPVIWAIL